MDGKIDRARKQRLLDLLGEQALAADLGQRPVADPVAGRRDGDDLDRRPSPSPCAAISRARVSSAWASASFEPRVPILISGVCALPAPGC